MGYYDGEPLAFWARSTGPASAANLVRTFRQVNDSLNFSKVNTPFGMEGLLVSCVRNCAASCRAHRSDHRPTPLYFRHDLRYMATAEAIFTNN